MGSTWNIVESSGWLELAQLAWDYASEIRRSPFVAPITANPSLSPFGLATHAEGWYPSHFLQDAALLQRPERAFPLRGLLAPATDKSVRARIEAQHRSALVSAFRSVRDQHKAFRILIKLDEFRALLSAFDEARNIAHPVSPVRAHEAEAMILYCVTMALSPLVRSWRRAPTRQIAREAKQAAHKIISLAAEGLHAMPSYWAARRALEELIRELDAPSNRKRARKHDATTAMREAFDTFDVNLTCHFGEKSLDNDLKSVRLRFATLIGFANPRAALSP